MQLGQTTAVAVVESFGMLDAFYPGRIDLGVGRSGQRRREAVKDGDAEARSPSRRREWRDVDGVVVPPPFDMSALMRNPRLRAQDVGAAAARGRRTRLRRAGRRHPGHARRQLPTSTASTRTPCPARAQRLTPWVFGSSKGQSAQVAGARGLPFVASYHITPATALDAIDAYRAAFQPSAALSEPYVVVSADVVVADDTATARHLASSYGHWVYSIRAGDGAIPYPNPDTVEPLTDEQLAVVKDRTATQFVGDPDEVADKLETLQRVTEADELVITSVTHRHADRLRSHELIAKRWGLWMTASEKASTASRFTWPRTSPGSTTPRCGRIRSRAARSSSTRSCTWRAPPSAACSTSSSSPRACGCASTAAASTTSTSSAGPTPSPSWRRSPRSPTGSA